MNADVKNAISPLPGEWCGGERAAGSLLPSLHLGGGQGAEWRQWDADSAQAAARTPGRLQVPGMSCCYSCHFKFTVVRKFFFKFAFVVVSNLFKDSIWYKKLLIFRQQFHSWMVLTFRVIIETGLRDLLSLFFLILLPVWSRYWYAQEFLQYCYYFSKKVIWKIKSMVSLTPGSQAWEYGIIDIIEKRQFRKVIDTQESVPQSYWHWGVSSAKLLTLRSQLHKVIDT